MSTYTDQLLDRIDQLTAQRDEARSQVAKIRATRDQFERVRRDMGDSHAAFAALREISVVLDAAP